MLNFRRWSLERQQISAMSWPSVVLGMDPEWCHQTAATARCGTVIKSTGTVFHNLPALTQALRKITLKERSPIGSTDAPSPVVEDFPKEPTGDFSPAAERGDNPAVVDETIVTNLLTQYYFWFLSQNKIIQMFEFIPCKTIVIVFRLLLVTCMMSSSWFTNELAVFF